MSDLVRLAAFALAAALLVLLGWWLLVATEGVYLGRRAVIFLYDLYANRYDDVKGFAEVYERALLADPLMRAVEPLRSPLVLDVATGTGRLPLALLQHPDFQGHIIGIDLSRRMLGNAALKLRGYESRAALLWWQAEELPFADGAFDVVTSLESLEFMATPEAVLREAMRVLRPGGLLLVTNRTGRHWMPGKTWPRERLAALLEAGDVALLGFEIWQEDYHKVWGQKRGDSPPTGARPLSEVLRCPRCPDALMIQNGRYWRCESCGGVAPVGRDGVIELRALRVD